MKVWRASVMFLAVTIFMAATAFAQTQSLIAGVGIDQKLDSQIDLNLTFRDETGKTVRLGDLFHGKPIVLAPVYYQCPSLCNLLLDGLVHTIAAMKFQPGREFAVVAVSFDPGETPDLAFAKRKAYVQDYGKPQTIDGWHFLTGNVNSIHPLMDQIGFRYKWDPKGQQWVHASTIVIITPSGRVSQYFYGVEYEATDLRLSLVKASSNKIGTLIDRLILYCCRFDPTTGKYDLVVSRSLQWAGAATVLLLFGFMFLMFRRDYRTQERRS